MNPLYEDLARLVGRALATRWMKVLVKRRTENVMAVSNTSPHPKLSFGKEKKSKMKVELATKYPNPQSDEGTDAESLH